jgi:hypothetical protein
MTGQELKSRVLDERERLIQKTLWQGQGQKAIQQ